MVPSGSLATPRDINAKTLSSASEKPSWSCQNVFFEWRRLRFAITFFLQRQTRGRLKCSLLNGCNRRLNYGLRNGRACLSICGRHFCRRTFHIKLEIPERFHRNGRVFKQKPRFHVTQECRKSSRFFTMKF